MCKRPSDMNRTSVQTVAALTIALLLVSLDALHAAEPSPNDAATLPHAAVSRPCWHKAPTLSVMTGFIYEPLKPFTIQQWMEEPRQQIRR